MVKAAKQEAVDRTSHGETVILFVSGLTGAWAKRYADLHANVGFLVTPTGNHKPETVLAHTQTWAMDNDCFNGLNRPAFEACLRKWQGQTPAGKFVAAPDVVGDAAETLRRFEEWEPIIHGMGFPVALVLQDGINDWDMPWNRIDAVFIGGTTRFKLSETACRLARIAKANRLWVHMGRVNSLRRMETAARFGCDSIDGSGFSRWRKLIEPGVRWMRIAKRRALEPELFGETGI